MQVVITNYLQAADLYHLSNQQLEFPKVDTLPHLAALSCVAWHFRRDHFCEGSLISKSIAEGTMLRLLQHLKALQITPCITTTLETLYRYDCISIPNVSGIYRILVPQGMNIQFLNSADNHSAAFYPVEELAQKYMNCQDKGILYIGKANGKHGLRQRIRQYIKYGWNEATNHKGGRAIWQIENFGLLLLEYEPCIDCETQEHFLLNRYRQENKTYPLANWRG